MFADLMTLRPAPIVGARLVRLLGVTDEEEKTVKALNEKLESFRRKYNAKLREKRAAAKAGDLPAYAQANREYKNVEYHMRRIRKQINEIEATE